MATTDPMTFLNRAEKYEKLANVAKTGIGAWMIAVSIAVIRGMQNILDLLVLTPIDVLTNVMTAAGESVLIGPLRVIDAGALASALGVQSFGFLGLPVAFVLVLGTYLILARYTALPSTSDVPFPGISVDVIPFVGAEDEEDQQ
ncbi:MAG: hypothetical protein ABEI57_00650 [Halapricum sp.]